MTEIEAESAAVPAVEALILQPLIGADLPSAVANVVLAATPARLMAAKGMTTLGPRELLIALYQLSFDADAAVKAAAEAAPAALPDAILLPALEGAVQSVSHFVATRLPVARQSALEMILLNRATADATVVILAGRLHERELQVIFANETRLLRCPAILTALFRNPQARMSSINRAIELCARNGVRVDGIPFYDEVLKSIREDNVALDPAVADVAFATVLTAAECAALVDDDAAAGDAADREEKKGSLVIDFTRLKLYEKIRLATLGNEYCRKNLLRDSNRMVAMASIRSPKITDGEIVKAAGNRAVCEDVIRYIANQRTLLKMYPVKLNLVHNPKCPIAMSLRLMPQLHVEDIKSLARSKNVPSALCAAAKRLMAAREANK